jgi:hypothetical protein
MTLALEIGDLGHAHVMIEMDPHARRLDHLTHFTLTQLADQSRQPQVIGSALAVQCL